MRKKLDHIIVVDIESTCWEGEPPGGQQSEIIEIGVCLLDIASGERIRRESILVRPQCSTISPFCTRLTTLTQEQVDTGMPFSAACQYLFDEYRTIDRTWASYGDYDRRMFESQCSRLGLLYPFGKTHLNVKNLLALALNLRAEVGLDRALDLLGLPMEGTHHRGGDDAWNIAAVLGVLLNRFRAE